MVDVVLLGREHGLPENLTGRSDWHSNWAARTVLPCGHLLTTKVQAGEAGNTTASDGRVGGLLRYETSASR